MMRVSAGTHTGVLELLDCRVSTVANGQKPAGMTLGTGTYNVAQVIGGRFDSVLSVIKINAITSINVLRFEDFESDGVTYNVQSQVSPTRVIYGGVQAFNALAGARLFLCTSSASVNTEITGRWSHLSNGTQHVQYTQSGPTLTLRGDVGMDITRANRIDGSVCRNSNTAANNGTDGVVGAGLFHCVGTASGSWKRAGTTGGAGNQY